ncbi:MAG: DUF6049 family protein [Candidatus Nanopelagicales bacterium]
MDPVPPGGAQARLRRRATTGREGRPDRPGSEVIRGGQNARIRALGVVAALMVPLMLGSAAAVADPSPAPAADPTPPVDTAASPAPVPAAPSPGVGGDRPALGAGALAIRITGFAPSIPGPDDQLTVRGTVTSTSDLPVAGVAVRLRVSPTPLINRDEIPEVLAGAGQRTGEPIEGALVEVADSLSPGQSVPFVLRAAVADLGLGSAGAYVTAAEALSDAGAGMVRQDLDRTFLPWWPADTPIAPLAVTTLWPMTGAPLRDAEGVLLSEESAVQLSPSGRLANLLAASAGSSVAMVLDPEIVDAAADLANGYLVRQPGGSTVPGTRSREAASWLADLQAAVTEPGSDVTGSLYAWPDVDATRRGRLLTRVLGQRAAVAEVAEAALDRPLSARIVLPPGGVALPETLSALAKGGMQAVVLRDQALPLVSPSYFTPSGTALVPTSRGPLLGLLLDTGLSTTLARPMGTPAEVAAARQALLAETLVTAAELPETQRLIIAGPDSSWSPSQAAAEMVVGALTEPDWVVPTSMRDALARETSSLARQYVAPTTEQQAAELPTVHVAAVRGQYRDLEQYATVTSEAAAIPFVAHTAPTRLLGAWFRTQPQARGELTDLVDAQTQALVDSVRVVSSGSITVSGASGTIPVTVENLGPTAVTIGLRLRSNPPQLVTADPVEPFTIEPGRRTSVEVTAQVAAAGPIPVTIAMLTAQGEPFGTPGELVVGSAAYADAAGVLVRVALGVLVLAVVVHGVRRARRMRRARAGQPATGAHGGGGERG